MGYLIISLRNEYESLNACPTKRWNGEGENLIEYVPSYLQSHKIIIIVLCSSSVMFCMSCLLGFPPVIVMVAVENYGFMFCIVGMYNGNARLVPLYTHMLQIISILFH